MLKDVAESFSCSNFGPVNFYTVDAMKAFSDSVSDGDEWWSSYEGVLPPRIVCGFHGMRG